MTHQSDTQPGKRPRVSIIIPCRNEERYIGGCLDSIIAGDYPRDRLEVLVVDGQSVDRTRVVVGAYAARYDFIQILENPKRITPCAMNVGIRQARGDVVMLLGAHAALSPTYVSRVVAALIETGADNVGGALVTLPSGDSATARAIALAMSHPFGVGNSHFRIGTAKRRWVETVGFGSYRKDVFQRIGLFDEALVRNQDGEFNARLIKHGGRILLIPDVVAYYYGRGTLAQVARMFFQYGYFKPLVAQKVGRVMTMRQVVPALFILSLLGTGLASYWFAPAGLLCAGIGGSYAAAVTLFACKAAHRHGLKCGAIVAAVFPILHFSYGLGFLKRALELPARSVIRIRHPAELPLSR